MRAALITPAINAMMDPRAFFWSGRSLGLPPRDNRSKAVPSPVQTHPQSSVGPELVPARTGEEYTCCERACCRGDHRAKRVTGGAYAAASLSSCGEKEGEWEGSAPRGVRSLRYHWSRRPDGKVLLRGRRWWWFMICETL